MNRRAECRVVQDSAAVANPGVGLRAIAAERATAELAEPLVQLREPCPGAESEKLERGVERLRCSPGVDQEEERGGETEYLGRDDQAFRTLAA